MPLLQVRDFPEPLYRALEQRAKAERRSIAQETIVLLDKELRQTIQSKQRRLAVLAKIDAYHEENLKLPSNLSNPVDLVREDRER